MDKSFSTRPKLRERQRSPEEDDPPRSFRRRIPPALQRSFPSSSIFSVRVPARGLFSKTAFKASLRLLQPEQPTLRGQQARCKAFTTEGKRNSYGYLVSNSAASDSSNTLRQSDQDSGAFSQQLPNVQNELLATRREMRKIEKEFQAEVREIEREIKRNGHDIDKMLDILQPHLGDSLLFTQGQIHQRRSREGEPFEQEKIDRGNAAEKRLVRCWNMNFRLVE